MDIFSKYGLFGCFNYIVGSYNRLLVYLNSTENVRVLGGWLKFMYLNVI